MAAEDKKIIELNQKNTISLADAPNVWIPSTFNGTDYRINALGIAQVAAQSINANSIFVPLSISFNPISRVVTVTTTSPTSHILYSINGTSYEIDSPAQITLPAETEINSFVITLDSTGLNYIELDYLSKLDAYDFIPIAVKNKTVGEDIYVTGGTIYCTQSAVGKINNDTDLVCFIDSSGSFSETDQTLIEGYIRDYYDAFKLANPSYTGNLYIYDYASERWLYEPVSILVANSLNNVFCFIFSNEAHPVYHNNNDSPDFTTQLTTQYSNDYSYFISQYPFFEKFYACLIAVPSSGVYIPTMINFQLHAYAAISGKLIDENDFIDSNLAISEGKTLAVIKSENPYSSLDKKLSDYGWSEVHHFSTNYIEDIPYSEFEDIADIETGAATNYEKKLVLKLTRNDNTEITIEGDISECLCCAANSIPQPKNTIESFTIQTYKEANTPTTFTVQNNFATDREVIVSHENWVLQKDERTYTIGTNTVTVTLPYPLEVGEQINVNYWYLTQGSVPIDQIDVTISNKTWSVNGANDVTLSFDLTNNRNVAQPLNFTITLNGVTHSKSITLTPYETRTITDIFNNVTSGTYNATISDDISDIITSIVVPSKAAILTYSNTSLASNSFTHTAYVTVTNSGNLAASDQVYFQWDSGAKLPSGLLNIGIGSSVIFTNTKVESGAGVHTCKIYKSDQVTLIDTLNFTVIANPSNVHPTQVWYAEVIDQSGALYPERYSDHASGNIDIGRINVNTGSVARIVAKFDTTYLKSCVTAKLKWLDARGSQAMTIYLNKSTFDVNNPNCIAIWNTYTDNLGGVQSYVGSGINQIELNATALNIIRNGGLTEILILMRESKPNTSNTEVVLNNLYLELTY